MATVALSPGSSSSRLDVRELGKKALTRATLLALRRLSRDADVVVAHGSRTLPACAIALAARGTPFVYRNIGDPLFWSRSASRRLRTRLLLSRAAAVVALTDSARRTLHASFGVPESRLTVIPNAVDGRLNRPADAKGRQAARDALGVVHTGPIAITIGALSPEKGVDDSIRAIGRLDDACLLVVGDGPERASLQRLAADSAPRRVQFTGALADPSPAFDVADVLVVSSRSEGLPAVLIEAGLRAIPTVATDVGYVHEVVVHDVTGIVVPPSDPAALARGITAALAQRERYGIAARERCAQRFELQPIADDWARLLRSLDRRNQGDRPSPTR